MEQQALAIAKACEHYDVRVVCVHCVASALAASEQPCSMCGTHDAPRRLCQTHYDDYKALQVKLAASEQRVRDLETVDCERLGQHQVCDHVLNQIEEAKDREARLALRVQELYARLEALGEAP
jgi:hypothetical protein